MVSDIAYSAGACTCFQMEDNLNFVLGIIGSKNMVCNIGSTQLDEIRLFFENGRQPQCFEIERRPNFFENGKRPQFVLNGRQPQLF